MPKWGRKRPRKLIFLVGLYTVGAGLYDMAYPAVTQNFREPVSLKQRYGVGTWAVISGATNELGKEFATQLCKNGFNLVLIDENQESLEGLKTHVKDLGYNVEVVPLKFELSKSQDWRDYDALN